MGLDMSLYGEKHISSLWSENPIKEDGFVLSGKIYDIGYWRKHPNLHGFIVDTFADGKDECRRIYLYADGLHKIIEALENDAIYDEPVTGLFFGRSIFPGEEGYDKQKADDLKIFRSALEWLTLYESNRSIYYQSSW